MPKFAPVGPVQVMSQLLHETNSFGQYHLMLAHHMVEREQEWIKLFQEHDKKHGYRRDLTVIMDNSLVELGGAVDDQMIKAAVELVNSNRSSMRHTVIPVLPDVMGVAEDTKVESATAYSRWTSLDHGRMFMPGESYMLVAQGETWEKFTELMNFFFVEGNYKKIGWVGIPRRLGDTIGTRARAVQYIKMIAPQVKIHLLGFSKNIADDMFCAQMGVTGIDSAVPIRYDKMLTPMTTDEEIGPRDPDWFENGKLLPQHVYNLQNVRKWVGE